ncbi:speract receptor-like [Babylonia areolata]|uniref:speract receptor-like n=1 Tax=Babylonia areolata TaxID=304850 RepID=UPI003FD47753
MERLNVTQPTPAVFIITLTLLSLIILFGYPSPVTALPTDTADSGYNKNNHNNHDHDPYLSPDLASSFANSNPNLDLDPTNPNLGLDPTNPDLTAKLNPDPNLNPYPPDGTNAHDPYFPNDHDIYIGYITGSLMQPDVEKGKFYDRPGTRISGALTYALEQVNADPEVLPFHTLRFLMAETYGEEEVSIRETALLLSERIAAYIGPQETCTHEGRIAAAFNVPMISYFCTETAVSDKALYPTFARTKPTDSQISKSVVSLLRMFHWSKVTFIHSNLSHVQHVANNIYSTLLENGFTVTFRRQYPGPYLHNHMVNPFVRIVQDTYLETRIYIMLGESYEFIGLMDHLQERGILDSGDYFVVGVCLNAYDHSNSRNFLEGVFSTRATEKTSLAFRHFVGLIHSPPVEPGYSAFQRVVDQYLERPPFNQTNPMRNINGTRNILPEAAYLYDAVWLYARAADAVLKEGKNLYDGREIISHVINQTYKSAFGYLSRINSKGDTGGNYSLIVCKKNDDTWGMFPIGNFRLNFESDDIPTFEFYENETIHWIAGRPPLDEPECGYHHELCIPPNNVGVCGAAYTRQIVGGVAGGLTLIGAIIGYLIYRNWRYEQELASLLWKIDYKDITFGEQLNQAYTCQWTSKACTQMVRCPSQISFSSQTEFDFRQLFTHVGTYRGTIVAIRRVNKKHVELTRNVRKELKIMRELRHDNINPFIGACIDSPSILIVSAYCTKGSLQDILANEDMQLDSMFIASLVHDIVRGMIYLHDSEVKSHGKLKSSNCVVDTRWVLKITDFGLHEFIHGARLDISDYAYYHSLLWRAPELLRDTAPSRGTQEGDVYAFGIILFEIYGRRGPYGDIPLSPKEIVERVRRREGDVPFRPRLSQLSTSPKVVTDLIRECWDDDPHRRPDFKTVRSKLKPIQKGLKSNIFDNMLAMMEKYADNLEALVEERTDLLIEEKKKTEELLHEMLPRTVADQLMMGKRVEADTFDNVTIYFSDICGFTAMSSESTPMQVVDLLNDLYTLFDSTIEYYDVYKVETIGDAYMVVSGLPKTNGIQHAGEIASLSLHLLDSIRRFTIRHRPQDTLKLRIGLHSGACVAGVVGLKMPRYCLFGDTVNTASRMESTGEPLKIHCSVDCKSLLDQLGGYTLEERGLTKMKGKGEVVTYWLTGEDRERRPHRLRPVSSDHSHISTLTATGVAIGAGAGGGGGGLGSGGVGGGSFRSTGGGGAGGGGAGGHMARCRSRSFERPMDRSPSQLSAERAAVHYYQGQVHFQGPPPGMGNGEVVLVGGMSPGGGGGGGGTTLPTSNSSGGGSRAPYLQPYGYLAGPSSQELLRRTSSRRRKFKFTIGPEEEELLKAEERAGGGGGGLWKIAINRQPPRV